MVETPTHEKGPMENRGDQLTKYLDLFENAVVPENRHKAQRLQTVLPSESHVNFQTQHRSEECHVYISGRLGFFGERVQTTEEYRREDVEECNHDDVEDLAFVDVPFFGKVPEPLVVLQLLRGLGQDLVSRRDPLEVLSRTRVGVLVRMVHLGEPSVLVFDLRLRCSWREAQIVPRVRFLLPALEKRDGSQRNDGKSRSCRLAP
mmetsp:Transcript_51344/g.100811  ORF Transcript_51344/g.100811 Transcript_51344/m.100811 type:complete len:204 (-) Transcript_51344:108-719(-)